MRIENDIKLDFKDVLIRPKRSTLKSRQQVSVAREYTFKNSGLTWSGVPVIAANMDTVGTFEMARALAKHQVITAVHKHYKVDEWKAFAEEYPEVLRYVCVSAGTSEDDFKKLGQIIKAIPEINMICLDVANGYSEHFVAFVRRVREAHKKKTIMAGNVVTGEMVEELILSGADIIKVGIGPGSVCTTRKKAGVGYPQLSAVIECADAAHGLGGFVVADGGCTNPGDIAKAFGGGADFVMLGGMFAGHEESAGATIEINGKKFKEFYGMSSATAMQKHAGGVAEYRASEGKHVHVPCKGPVSGTVLDILGGLRSACTYVGAASLKNLSKCTTFIRVSQQTNEIWAGQPGEENKAPAAVAAAAPVATPVAAAEPVKAETKEEKRGGKGKKAATKKGKAAAAAKVSEAEDDDATPGAVAGANDDADTSLPIASEETKVEAKPKRGGKKGAANGSKKAVAAANGGDGDASPKGAAKRARPAARGSKTAAAAASGDASDDEREADDKPKATKEAPGQKRKR